jgi:hypothetical protein
MEKGRKTNTVVQEEQLNIAFELIVYKRLSYVEFKEIYSKEMGISQRQAENVWAKVKTILKERYKDERDEILETQLNRMYDLLNRCRDAGNRRVEAEILRDINKLYGLDAPQKIDITSGGDPIAINIVLNND